MKKIILVLVAFTGLIACSNTQQSNDNRVEQNTVQPPATDNSQSENTLKDDDPASVMLGTWTGEISEKKLTLVIEKINGTKVEGYNIWGSNRRTLAGTFTDGVWDQPCTKAYMATLNEPGDDQGDGMFAIKFVGYEDEEETESGPECKGNLKGVEARGEWISKNGKIKKDIDLVKQK